MASASNFFIFKWERNLVLANKYVKAYMYLVRELSQFHAALADTNRLRLLHLLKNGETCVCHLQGVLQTNQPRISRHLAYLKRAGLVAARREGKWMHYRLKPLKNGLNAVLNRTLACLQQHPQIKKDTQRFKQITCSPGRYGISSFQKNRANCC